LERDFPHPFRHVPGTLTAYSTVGTGLLTAVERPGRDVDHSSPSSAKVVL